jgi:hypothetical protein
MADTELVEARPSAEPVLRRDQLYQFLHHPIVTVIVHFSLTAAEKDIFSRRRPSDQELSKLFNAQSCEVDDCDEKGHDIVIAFAVEDQPRHYRDPHVIAGRAHNAIREWFAQQSE